MRTRVEIMVLGVMLLTACAGTRVDIAPNAAVDTARHYRYAWEVDPIAGGVRRDGIYLIDHYLRRRVDEELIGRGYRPVDRQQADMLVTYRLSQRVSEDRGGLISPQNSAADAWDPRLDPSSTALHHHVIPAQIRRGNLELLLVDAVDQRPLWRATLSKIIETETDDEAAVKQAMNRQVPKLLRGFPRADSPH